jgi:uncharacterized membrane protein YtjA (UPF0391 family)
MVHRDLAWNEKERRMLSWALAFFILALIAALFGFSGLAVGLAGIAKILFFLFLVLFLVALLANAFRGRAPPL